MNSTKGIIDSSLFDETCVILRNSTTSYDLKKKNEKIFSLIRGIVVLRLICLKTSSKDSLILKI